MPVVLSKNRGKARTLLPETWVLRVFAKALALTLVKGDLFRTTILHSQAVFPGRTSQDALIPFINFNDLVTLEFKHLLVVLGAKLCRYPA